MDVRVVDPTEIPRWHGKLVACYREVFTRPPWSEGEYSVEWFESMLGDYAASSGFRCAVAVDGDDLAGFLLGMDLEEMRWYRSRIAEALGPQADGWVEEAWLLAELAVGPDRRGRGIGGMLHDAVVPGLPNPTALLITHPEAEPARRLYANRGWEVVHERFFMWPGADRMLILGLDRRADPTRP